MYRLLVTVLALVALLPCGPTMAQDAPKQAPTIDGRSLASPDDQRAADEAIHTEGGRAGRDEPGAHAPINNPRNDPPVLKDGKLNVPGAPTQSQTTPGGPIGTIGERP
jgi:hypothetical protein